MTEEEAFRMTANHLLGLQTASELHRHLVGRTDGLALSRALFAEFPLAHRAVMAARSAAAGQRPRVGPTKAAVGRSGKISRKTASSSQPEAAVPSRTRYEVEIDRAWAVGLEAESLADLAGVLA